MDGEATLPVPAGESPRRRSLPERAITYHVHGFTKDSLRHVTFEIGEAAKVKPGQVLIQRWDETRQQDVDVVISLAAFEQMGQDPRSCS